MPVFRRLPTAPGEIALPAFVQADRPVAGDPVLVTIRSVHDVSLAVNGRQMRDPEIRAALHRVESAMLDCVA